MIISEAQLIYWTKPLSTTEDNKCKTAVSAVTEAIRAKFGNRVSIFLQGSYQNNTNVRKDSDVDVVVRHDDYFYSDLVFLSDEEKRRYNESKISSNYTFDTFKQEVQNALEAHFGRTEVKRKNKCLTIKENTYRINADVVPCFVLRRFSSVTKIEAEGIKFFPDSGSPITSYPEQHYTNGVNKNTDCSRMYKRTVRIFKNLKTILVGNGTIDETLVSSFTIESLVYNVPNSNFVLNNYQQTLRNVISVIYHAMETTTTSDTYLEVSKCLYLYRGGDKSPSDARLFMLKCWEYAGF